MPALLLQKHSSKGKAKNKTEIINIEEVAFALKVPERVLMMHFCESSQGSYLNGCFSKTRLANLLDEFIEKYVICLKCLVPELQLEA